MRFHLKDEFYFHMDYEFLFLTNTYNFYLHKTKTNNYVKYKEKGGKKRGLLHRLLLQVTDIKIDVDHINHNGLDNRLENLRLVSRTINNHNRRKEPAGCYYEARTNKWRADIWFNKKRYRLGRFDTKEEACKEYRIKKKELLQIYSTNSK